MNKEIIAELKSTSANLKNTIDSFTQESFNKVPFEGSWTAGQVCDHLYQSVSWTLQNVNGISAEAPRDRKPLLDNLKGIFLNFNEKFKSPEFILPSDGPHNRDAMSKNFEDTFNGLLKFAENSDLTLICSDFEFPGVGELTRFEWLSFASYHTIRHTRQMENIHSKLDT